jgi:hypothetical protein
MPDGKQRTRKTVIRPMGITVRITGGSTAPVAPLPACFLAATGVRQAKSPQIFKVMGLNEPGVSHAVHKAGGNKNNGTQTHCNFA